MTGEPWRALRRRVPPGMKTMNGTSMKRGAPDAWRRALVLGLGTSGRAAAELLLANGIDVTVIDGAAGTAAVERAAGLRTIGADVRLDVRECPVGDYDIGIVSPGIRVDAPWMRTLAERGVPVISELELGARFCSIPLLAVTGTNGKSTMVKLCGEALARAGRRVAVGGNYGTPLCELVMRQDPLDWLVVEVSSFQLETVDGFRPRVGVLLNVQPDHLDRHGSMDAYRTLKARLFARMRNGDTAVVLDADAVAAQADVAAWRSGFEGRGPDWVTFGRDSADVAFEDGWIRFGAGRERKALSIQGSVLDGPVTGLTVAAAVAALRGCGEDPACVAAAAATFEPLPHRTIRVATIRGVVFVDDSKGTNLAALCAGVKAATGPVRLIAGGQLKEKDLSWPKEVLAKQVVAIYLIGECSRDMWQAWHEVVPCRLCGDLNTAVRQAWTEAAAGDVVLLSPGCASFDQFRSYAHRGEEFVRIVRLLSEED